MDEKVVGAAVTRMLDLADILELVVDALDDRTFTQKQLVGKREQPPAHILARFGHEVKAPLDQELLGERLGDVAAIPTEFADETTRESGDRTPVIHVAPRQAEGQQLAPIVDDQVEFEAIKPTY